MTNQLEFRHLHYFLVLADTLHYREAAEKLYISQSALSQQIQRLEFILGEKLFIRTNRKVSLSPEGIIFKQEAMLIQNQAAVSMERWKSAISGKQGLLKIGFVGSAMQQYLPSVIKKFTESHPNIEFYLNDLSNTAQLSALEAGQIDIGFIRSNVVSPTMEIKSVFKEKFALVLPKNHAISKANFKDVSQLSEESFILLPNKDSVMYYDQIVALCSDHGFAPKISHRSIHAPTIFKLVEGGLGISIVPNSLRDEKNTAIKFIELDNVPQETELFAVWNKKNTNMALPYFLEVL
ncbi:LysR family transcriptional regulator [Maribacter sp. SA7]|uniref:LysR family transcriptional regulator n=1 Tax=Maribacter zhoushanensis TaxID=3030012 RepID=UPI0023EAC4B9|nr:LysR family transcriptional regulator [Maribacter zhoushanensis]MDF4202896.1 LysR family transcriptional regulator [Maribacter zhoushanensis]